MRAADWGRTSDLRLFRSALVPTELQRQISVDTEVVGKLRVVLIEMDAAQVLPTPCIHVLSGSKTTVARSVRHWVTFRVRLRGVSVHDHRLPAGRIVPYPVPY